MAKAKSKNPIGRPRFEVTPEVIQSARTERAMAQGLTKEQCAGATWYFTLSTFQLYQAENVGIFGSYKKG
jgi:hypothetical protein